MQPLVTLLRRNPFRELVQFICLVALHVHQCASKLRLQQLGLLLHRRRRYGQQGLGLPEFSHLSLDHIQSRFSNHKTDTQPADRFRGQLFWDRDHKHQRYNLVLLLSVRMIQQERLEPKTKPSRTPRTSSWTRDRTLLAPPARTCRSCSQWLKYTWTLLTRFWSKCSSNGICNILGCQKRLGHSSNVPQEQLAYWRREVRCVRHFEARLDNLAPGCCRQDSSGRYCPHRVRHRELSSSKPAWNRQLDELLVNFKPFDIGLSSVFTTITRATVELIRLLWLTIIHWWPNLTRLNTTRCQRQLILTVSLLCSKTFESGRLVDSIKPCQQIILSAMATPRFCCP